MTKIRALLEAAAGYFYPIFEDHFFAFKNVLLQNSLLMYG